MAVVLVTRPEEAAARTAAIVRRLGHTPLLAPVSVIQPLVVPSPDLVAVQALLVTSRHAVPPVASWRPGLPVFAVGAGTAAALRASGVAVAGEGSGDGTALGRMLADRLEPAAGALLHASGTSVAGGLRRAVQAAGFAYRALPVYAARTAPGLPAAVREALAAGTVDAVALYSPESARRFVVLLADAGLEAVARRLSALCLSANVATAARALEWKAMHVAPGPDETGMGALLEAVTF